MAIVNIDAISENANWLRLTWSIPATNLRELRAWLDEQDVPVKEFKTTLVYRANLERLPWLRGL